MTALRWNIARLLAAGFALAGLLVTAAPGAAASAAAAVPCVSMTRVQPTNTHNRSNVLNGVSVRSPCNAWAVGNSLTTVNNHRTLLSFIVHWDGASWTPSQNPGVGDLLGAVAAISATSAWAVGTHLDSNGAAHTLIEHWDGTSWTQVASPSPGTGSTLRAVAATSATNAWAVGAFSDSGGSEQTLIEHWDGTSWTQVPSPSPGTLNGVIGIGWAVGQQTTSSGADQTVIEHWDGRKWSVVPGADLGSGSTGSLAAVSATSPANIWAVGTLRASDGSAQDLIEHYDGTSWTQSASPGPGELTGVSVTGASDAWAVGGSQIGQIVHYDGTSWTPVPSQPVGGLNAVSASSPASVWAVGDGTPGPTLALHLRCC